MRTLKRYRQEKVVPIARDEVWRILSDTNHLNCILGLFKVEYAGVAAGKTGVYRKTMTRIAGSYQLKWKEFPFQWNKGSYYNNLREYENGPMRSILSVVELYDHDMFPEGIRGTRIVLGADVLAANWIGELLIPSIVNKSMDRMFKYTLAYLQLKTEGKAHAVPQLKAEFEVNKVELDRLLNEVLQTEANPDLIPLFRDHLIHQGDDEVIDMRPYMWADIWGYDREDVLRFYLYCTNAGILNLKWHLICPNCRVSKSSSNTLSEVKNQYHCDFCGVNYEASLDKYMELCFSVHPAVRKANKAVYCIGGPAITPHIYLQSFIRTGEPVELLYPEEMVSLRMRVLQSNHAIHFINKAKLDVNSMNSTQTISGIPDVLHYTPQGWSYAELLYSDRSRKVVLKNDTAADIVVVFEKLEWDDLTVTAAKVSAMHEFRRMFSSEILAPDHEVGIENVTFFFSDLLGSTVFYENVGDAHAYGQVRKHFDFLSQWINLNKGTIVKTIGDAVMAVFEKPEDGVKAALEIQHHIAAFNAAREDQYEQPIVIKIGIHQGSAIAVTSNNRIDYFGRNVNIAARVQGLSKGNDVVVSSSCMARAQVVDFLAAQRVETHVFDAVLRGIENKQSVFQIKLAAD